MRTSYSQAARSWARSGLVVAALIAASAAPSRAQIMFDGNIYWNNGANPALQTNQFTGSTTSALCTPGYNALELGTVTFLNNSFVDPLLPASAFAGNPGFDINPDFRPMNGSPAYGGNPGHGKVLEMPDPWFTPVCYVGAVPFKLAENWHNGWTYFNQNGAGRTDIDYTKPLVIVDNHNFYENRTFDPDSNYLIRGNNRVKDQATLIIPAGTVLFEEKATTGTIVIERGGKIDAQGTAAAPIIFTSDEAPGTQTPGSSGGLFVNGWARVNSAAVCAGLDSLVSEGGNGGVFGGSDDAWNAGTLRYVRIEFAGVAVSLNNESNSFTFNGIGNGTTLEHLQAHRGLDDSFEFFGGDARARWLVATDNDDDGFDWQLGARGKAQFVIVRLTAAQAGADKGIEADHDGTASGTRRDSISCSGRGGFQISNFTFIGDRRSGAGFGVGPTHGIHLREGTGGTIVNSIVTSFKSSGLNVQHNETYAAHCPAIPTALPIDCDVTTGVGDQVGRVFVTHGVPNPFSRSVAIRFALPSASHVRVEVFGADGRLMTTLANGPMTAGEHSVRWDAGRDVPTGMYFYRVRTSDAVSTGKVMRVD